MLLDQVLDRARGKGRGVVLSDVAVDGPTRPRPVVAPDGEREVCAERVGLPDHLFLVAASRSLRRTTRCLRWRTPTRVFTPGAALLPAQPSLVQGAPDRKVLAPGSPSGAWRRLTAAASRTR